MSILITASRRTSSVLILIVMFFFCNQKTAYEMRISDLSSDVCSSDLVDRLAHLGRRLLGQLFPVGLGEIDHALVAQPGQRHDGDDGQQAEQRRQMDYQRKGKPPHRHKPSPSRPSRCRDRKSVVSGKSVSGRVDLGGRRPIKKKKQTK